MSLLILYLKCLGGTIFVMSAFFIILCINSQYLQKLRSSYQKEQLREYLSIDKLSSFSFSHFSRNYFLSQKNNDDWNDSILSKPSDILCRKSIQSDNISLKTLNFSDESIVNTYQKQLQDQFDSNRAIHNNSNMSKSYVIPISAMEKNLNFDETLLEDIFNEDIKTKLCSTRRRHSNDDNYEPQSCLL